jgi:hypothetical protein
MLPEHLRKAAALPDEVEIGGRKYLAHPLTSMESVKYYDMHPQLTEVKRGKAVIKKNIDAGQVMKASAYAIFVTLKKQEPSMKDDTFDSFLKELDDLKRPLNSFVLAFTPLLTAVVTQDTKVFKKKTLASKPSPQRG